jgi:hypothetical protein
MAGGYGAAVIESLHVATGAAIGEAAGSRFWAFVLGPIAHAIGDVIPHDDIPSDEFETISGLLAGLWVVYRRGPLSPAAVGAFAAALPDLEHLFRLERRGKREYFPTHRYASLHGRGGIPAWVQLVAAAGLLATLNRFARRDRP